MNSQSSIVHRPSTCVVCGWDGQGFGTLPEIQGAERLCKPRFWFGPDLCSECAMECKGLSVWQPWAGLMAIGEKTMETRFWETKYRGPVLICAAKKFDDDWRYASSRPNTPAVDNGACRLLGVALAVATLADCRKMRPGDQDASMVRYHIDRWCWVLDALRPVTPFDVCGRQGLFTVTSSVLRK